MPGGTQLSLINKHGLQAPLDFTEKFEILDYVANACVEMRSINKKLLDTKELTLEEWLDLLRKPGKTNFIDYEFPSDKHRSEYLSTIQDRPESEVIELLQHFLIPSASLGTDEWTLKWLLSQEPAELEKLLRFQYYRRLLFWSGSGSKTSPPWEGITWILDLLPHFPRQALGALDSYFLAHAQFLPDGRFRGLADAAELIREKFIGAPDNDSDTLKILLDINPRHFECIVERLYDAMDYKTLLTPERADSGRDIIATRSGPAKAERLIVECKRYSKPVSIKETRSILGVVSSEKANKGVIVTTSRFTKGAREFALSNKRIELIKGSELVLLLNEYLGARWPLHIERLVSESLKKKNGSHVLSSETES